MLFRPSFHINFLSVIFHSLCLWPDIRSLGHVGAEAVRNLSFPPHAFVFSAEPELPISPNALDEDLYPMPFPTN